MKPVLRKETARLPLLIYRGSGYAANHFMKWMLDRTARRAIEETWAIFSDRNITPNPALFIARLSDLARSNSFLWVEAGLGVQERYSRVVPIGLEVSRILVLATVAADIFVGYSSLFERGKWLPSLVQPKDWELQHQRGADRVLDTASSLGGALIKACQFASTRPDLLPTTYIRTLSRLQDRLPAHPWSQMEEAITRELKRHPQDVFAEIEPAPVAAASIAKVHRARLHGGRQVAVKIQYPEITNLMATDLAVMEKAVAAIARLAPSFQLQPILDYLKETLPLELDFKREATAMTELRTVLQHRPDVLIPTVIPELSTERLIVMDFIDGIKITDREALVKADISPHEVAKVLNDLYADQMLHLGMLHADPHPGNLLVQPGPRLVLLDHGLTVHLTPSLVDSLRQMVQALNMGDFDALIKALTAGGLQFNEQVDITTLLQLVGVLLGNEGTSNAPEAVEVGIQLGKSIGNIPVNLLLIGRALGLLDGITKQLDPELDTLEIIAHYV